MIPAITLRRIVNARRAMMNAQDPKFKEFWQSVIHRLSEAYD